MTKPFEISHAQAVRAMDHAAKEYPKESCGFIIAGRYKACENIAENPTQDFEISSEETLAAYRTGKLQAVIHSHPGGPQHPTETDMRQQIAMNIPWGIIKTHEGGAEYPVWWGPGVAIPPLEGRRFVHGITDCFAAIRDWWRTEGGVEFPDFPREDAWWLAGGNLYMGYFKRYNFDLLPRDGTDPKRGDVLIMTMRSPVPNHAGVYLGDGLMLHHFAGSLSRIEPAHIWHSKIDGILRWNGTMPEGARHA